MFDEVVFKSNLSCRLLVGHVALAKLGQDRAYSLVAISHSLDKLIVSRFHPYRNDEQIPYSSISTDNAPYSSDATGPNRPFYYIAINDVIKTIAVRSIVVHDGTNDNNVENDSGASHLARDLLLIGCPNSIRIYDPNSPNNLITIKTSAPINAISSNQANVLHPVTVCGGPQKVYSLRFDSSRLDDRKISAELTSERSTQDTITCLTSGLFHGLDLILTGSSEQKLRIFQLDSFDQNIQNCKITIDETGPISCLYPVNTEQQVATTKDAVIKATNLPQVAPSTHQSIDELSSTATTAVGEQMSHFAFGTENGTIGVYRLFPIFRPKQQRQQHRESCGLSLSSERLWRQRCKQTPITMLLYDINGDGLDELIIGFASSRLEARSPFTGQLLATTRCFKTDKLASLAVIDYHNDGCMTLLACSVGGSMIGFRPRVSRPKVALQGFALPAQQEQRMFSDLVDGMFEQSKTAATTTTLSNSLRTIDSGEFVGQASGGGDVSMKDASDLHIESSKSNDLITVADTGNRPSKSEARQSHDLLLRVSALQSEQMELEKKACQIYYTNVYQASKFRSVFDLSIGHRWDFDVIETQLRLTLIISSKSESLHLIELEDEMKNLLDTGRMLVTPAAESKISSNETGGKTYVVVMSLQTKKDVHTTLTVRAFCEFSQAGPVDIAKKIPRECNIYTKLIEVPQFAMLIPDYVVAASSSAAAAATSSDDEMGMRGQLQDSRGKRIRLNFRLRDRDLQLAQTFEWLRESFLFFEFGNLIDDDIGGSSFSSQINDKFARASSINTKVLTMDNAGNFKLALLDTRQAPGNKVGGQEPSGTGKSHGSYEREGGSEVATRRADSSNKRFSRLCIAASGSSLALECENLELAVAVVQSLVIDRLNIELKLNDNLEQGQQFEADVEPVLDELDSLTESSRQLEESERRIQTELYESADHTKNLMLQLGIANELNEFATARDLLNELIIMLNGLQNSARAQYLNSKSHSEILKQINGLKGKIFFLTGQTN